MVQVPALRCDLIDVLERVLTKGVVFEFEDAQRSATDRSSAFSVDLLDPDVDVFKSHAGTLSRFELETEGRD